MALISTTITNPDGAGVVIVHKPADRASGASQTIHLDPGEQREVLEALARVHGFSLIDREERRDLRQYVTETDGDDNQYDSATEAWTTWQNRCEALASAVNAALDA